jgi:methylated-DNA-[protein]-cysteine S-methyltransferase
MNPASTLAAMAHVFFPTAFGICGIAWNDTGLTAFQLPDETDELAGENLARRSHSLPAEGPPPAWVQSVIDRAQRHLAGDLQDFSDVPLDWSRVSDFQQAVYLQNQAIPAGHKKSYGEIARLMAMGPEAARAVGVALATNPWPLIVPCHRVVSARDKMTGFSAWGGVRTKTRLLALEGAELLSE